MRRCSCINTNWDRSETLEGKVKHNEHLWSTFQYSKESNCWIKLLLGYPRNKVQPQCQNKTAFSLSFVGRQWLCCSHTKSTKLFRCWSCTLIDIVRPLSVQYQEILIGTNDSNIFRDKGKSGKVFFYSGYSIMQTSWSDLELVLGDWSFDDEFKKGPF